MGAYLNPPTTTKERWLVDNAVFVKEPPQSIDELPDCLPVCLVDNGAFTAAGIAYNEQELKHFKDPDGRRKTWFWAEIEKLKDPSISNLIHYLK